MSFREDLSASLLIPGAAAPVRVADVCLGGVGQVRRVARKVRNRQVFPCGNLRRALKSAVIQEGSRNDALLSLRVKTMVSFSISSSSKRD